MNCNDCKSQNCIVDDWKNGCAVCTKCGIVASNLISEEAEWRTFESDTAESDKNRVGHELQRGLPHHIQMSSMSQFGRALSDDTTEWLKYHEPRNELKQIFRVLGLSNAALDLGYELFGLYRSCVHVIRHMEAVLLYVAYHVAFLVRHPLPLSKVANVLDVDKKHILQAGRHLCDLVDGVADNKAARGLVMSNHNYTHLRGHSLEERVGSFLNDMCDRFRLPSGKCPMQKLLRLYLKKFPDSQRSPETVSAGIFYHIVRHLNDNAKSQEAKHILLADVSAYAMISDSAVNDMVHQLPKFNVPKRKRV